MNRRGLLGLIAAPLIAQPVPRMPVRTVTGGFIQLTLLDGRKWNVRPSAITDYVEDSGTGATRATYVTIGPLSLSAGTCVTETAAQIAALLAGS